MFLERIQRGGSTVEVTKGVQGGEKKAILTWNISFCGSKQELHPKGEEIIP